MLIRALNSTGLSKRPLAKKGLSLKTESTPSKTTKRLAKADKSASFSSIQRRALGDITNTTQQQPKLTKDRNKQTSENTTRTTTQKQSAAESPIEQCDEVDTLFGTPGDEQYEADYVNHDFDIPSVVESVKRIKTHVHTTITSSDHSCDLRLEEAEFDDIQIDDHQEAIEEEGQVDLIDCQFDVEAFKLD